MQKKNFTVTTETSTPKSNSKNTRTASQNSSSSSKAKPTKKVVKNPIDKQNQSENFDLNRKVQKNGDTNPMKSIKRIKEIAQGETKGLDKKDITKNQETKKLGSIRTISQASNHTTHSKQSLGMKKTGKSSHLAADKKISIVKGEKSTSKSTNKKIQTKSKTSNDTPKSAMTSKISMLSQKKTRHSEQLQHIPASPELQSSKIQQRSYSISSASCRPEKPVMISMFKIVHKVSQSPFSTTFQVLHIQTNFLYCLKVFQKRKIKQQGLQNQIITQIKYRTNNNHHHPALQKLYTVFSDEVYLYFVEEFITGFRALERDILARRKFPERELGAVFRQVLDAVVAMHSQYYIHRDIRLENVAKCLGVIKITNFSWVACLRYKKQRDTFCGTYKFAPPELLDGQSYDESIDTWSLGMLLYELSTGQAPFTENRSRSSHSMNFPIFLSNQLVDLIGRLLAPKQLRMRVEQIMIHEWTNKWELDGFVCKEIWDFWVLI